MAGTIQQYPGGTIQQYPPAASGAIKSIQRGTITLSGVTSNTATITAVDMDSTEIDYTFFRSDGTTQQQGYARLELTNATTITAYKDSATNTVVVPYEVVEYDGGKSIQRGTIILATVSSNTATLSLVDIDKTRTKWLGETTDATSGINEPWAHLVLESDGVTLTAQRSPSTKTVTVGYEIIEEI